MIALVQQRQVKWMSNHTQLTGIMHEEILKPAADLLAELAGRKRRRFVKKDEPQEWKRTDIIIRLNNKEIELGFYKRPVISKLVLHYQSTDEWTEPVLHMIFRLL
jgi:hypothetical protein